MDIEVCVCFSCGNLKMLAESSEHEPGVPVHTTRCLICKKKPMNDSELAVSILLTESFFDLQDLIAHGKRVQAGEVITLGDESIRAAFSMGKNRDKLDGNTANKMASALLFAARLESLNKAVSTVRANGVEVVPSKGVGPLMKTPWYASWPVILGGVGTFITLIVYMSKTDYQRREDPIIFPLLAIWIFVGVVLMVIGRTNNDG